MRADKAQAMQWNAGAWFGGQIGATCWMLVAGVLATLQGASGGALVVALFAIANLLGWWLWRGRRLSCYAATQLIIGVSALCGLLSVFILDRADVWERIQSGGVVSAMSTYLIIVLAFGAVMLNFHLRFGRNRSVGGD